MTAGFCKAQAKDIKTGEVDRTPVLVVMSHARFLCATPVKVAPFNVQLDNLTGGWNRTNDLRSAEANPLRAYRLRHTGYKFAQVP